MSGFDSTSTRSCMQHATEQMTRGSIQNFYHSEGALACNARNSCRAGLCVCEKSKGVKEMLHVPGTQPAVKMLASEPNAHPGACIVQGSTRVGHKAVGYLQHIGL